MSGGPTRHQGRGHDSVWQRRAAAGWALSERSDIPVARRVELLLDLLDREIASPTRAIARPISPSRPLRKGLDDRDPYAYVGYKFADGTEEDCPDMRPGGKEVLTANVQLVDADPDGFPLSTQGRPVLGRHRRVRADAEPRRSRFPRVQGDRRDHGRRESDDRREPAYQAGYVASIPKEYRGQSRKQISDYDLLPRLAPRGKLPEGVYQTIDDERVTISVGKVVEIPSLVDE